MRSHCNKQAFDRAAKTVPREVCKYCELRSALVTRRAMRPSVCSRVEGGLEEEEEEDTLIFSPKNVVDFIPTFTSSRISEYFEFSQFQASFLLSSLKSRIC